ncbi:hypothetical protein BCR44DRAFT_1439777 [Catenaria anguillulae PL171]|uniref:NDT80 domain-containing protein n=1 Tax=Catenaria anguillulae PL171 TaxID=765915 RepID=A0A1Y2HG90_9FUNG|nr:hypothetical protein BCR44DRAFT_1439777 [Catenaria anguillulae PL171]
MSDRDRDIDSASPRPASNMATHGQSSNASGSHAMITNHDQRHGGYSYHQVAPNPAPNRQRSSRTRWEGLPTIGGGPRFVSTQLARVRSVSGRTEYALSLWAKLDKGFHFSVVDGFPCAFKRNYSEIVSSCSATALPPTPARGSSNQHVPPREPTPVPASPLTARLPADDEGQSASGTRTGSGGASSANTNSWTILVQPPGSDAWIQCTNLRLAPRVAGPKGERIGLVQRTCKRDRGPTLAVVPQACWPLSTAAAAAPGRPGQVSSALEPGATVVWERVQFSKATPAAVVGGKSSSDGRCDEERRVATFCMYVELIAAPVDGGNDIVIAHAKSDPFVVRSRSPGQYAMANAIAGGLVAPLGSAAASRGGRERSDSGTFAAASSETGSLAAETFHDEHDDVRSAISVGAHPILALHDVPLEGPDRRERLHPQQYRRPCPDLRYAYPYPPRDQPMRVLTDYQDEWPQYQPQAYHNLSPPAGATAANPHNRDASLVPSGDPTYYGGYFPPTPLSATFAPTSPRGSAADGQAMQLHHVHSMSALAQPIEMPRAWHSQSAPPDFAPPGPAHLPAHYAHQPWTSPRYYSVPTARYHAGTSAAAAQSTSSSSSMGMDPMYVNDSLPYGRVAPQPHSSAALSNGAPSPARGGIGMVPPPPQPRSVVQPRREHGTYGVGSAPHPHSHPARWGGADHGRGQDARFEGVGQEYSEEDRTERYWAGQ